MRPAQSVCRAQAEPRAKCSKRPSIQNLPKAGGRNPGQKTKKHGKGWKRAVKCIKCIKRIKCINVNNMGTCSDCTTYVQVGFMLCLQCALQILVSQAWDNRVCSAAKLTLRAKLLKVLKSFLEIQVLKLNRILTEVFTVFFSSFG